VEHFHIIMVLEYVFAIKIITLLIILVFKVLNVELINKNLLTVNAFV